MPEHEGRAPRVDGGGEDPSVGVDANGPGFGTVSTEVADSAPFPIFAVDADGGFGYVNPAAASLLGRDVGTLLGLSLEDVSCPGSAGTRALFDEANHPSGVELSLCDAQGKPRILACNVLPWEGDQVLVLGGDITRRRLTEVAVEEITSAIEPLVGDAFQRELVANLSRVLGVRYLFVAELLPAGRSVRTVALAADGKLVDGIEYELGGTPCAKVVGASACYYPSGVQELFPRDVLLQEMGIEGYYGFPLADAGGHPIGIVVALHDEPLEDEAWIRTLFSVFATRAGAELARTRAEERRRSLEAQLERSRRFEALGTLAGGIAHDFNNLLTGILGNADLAREFLPEEAEAIEFIDDIVKASDRAKALISQIHTFSRYSRPDLKPMPLAPVVEEALRTIRRSGGSRVDFEMRHAIENDVVMGDGTQLLQVVLNLGLNAIQAMPEGGSCTLALDALELEAADGTLGLEPGPYLVLSVADTGPGIETAEIERIFDPFYTTKRARGGLGLGLSVVHQIVKQHDGAIRVRPGDGGGTVFEVFLPSAAATPEAGETPSTVEEGDAVDHLRVLFVDDEDMLVRLGRRMLERLGHEGHFTTSAPDALAELERAPDSYDVLMTDLGMPILDGIQVTQRARERVPDLPVIMMSGHAEALEGPLPEGVEAFVNKPFTRDEIARILGRIPRRVAR